MQIYIADLEAYNNGIYRGEWLELPMDNEDLKKIILKYTNNGQSDFALHDWELPFEIREYSDPFKINEACEIIEELDLNTHLIQHLEYAFSVDFLTEDKDKIKEYLEDIFSIDATSNGEFATNYMFEVYGDNFFLNMPWELSYSIDYNTVFEKLEMTLSITEDPTKKIYYYSNK